MFGIWLDLFCGREMKFLPQEEFGLGNLLTGSTDAMANAEFSDIDTEIRGRVGMPQGAIGFL